MISSLRLIQMSISDINVEIYLCNLYLRSIDEIDGSLLDIAVSYLLGKVDICLLGGVEGCLLGGVVGCWLHRKQG